MAYTKYSLTPANNNAAPPNGAPEGMLPSAVNDTMRDMMAEIRDCGDGIRTGVYALTAPIITGGSINGSTVGASTASTGRFSTLEYSGTLTGGTGVVNLGSGQFVKDASGNVGIGTSSPTELLDASKSVDGLTAIALTNANTGVAVQTRLRLNNSAGTFGTITHTGGGFTTGGVFRQDGTYVFGNGAGGLTLTTGAAQPIYFATNNTERMRIDSSGNLLVGTTSNTPSGKIIATATAGVVNGVGVFCTTTATTGAVVFFNANGQVGTISVSGSSTAYATSSDYRLKDTIAPMTDALSKVALLKPCTYKWKSDGSDGQGFIAHEINEVVPGCVTGEKDAVDKEGKPVYQGIDTSFLVATLTAAIQEQQALIQNLTTRLNALEEN